MGAKTPPRPADIDRAGVSDSDYFNESFRQASERRQRFWWPNFEILQRSLTTRSFCTKLFTFPGGITPSERPIP